MDRLVVVLNGSLQVAAGLPDETPVAIRGRVLRIELNDPIEILAGAIPVVARAAGKSAGIVSLDELRIQMNRLVEIRNRLVGMVVGGKTGALVERLLCIDEGIAAVASRDGKQRQQDSQGA